MDKKVQDFLNKFHQIMGIVSQQEQAQTVLQFEQAAMQRIAAAFMNGLTKEQCKKCADFIKQSSTLEQQEKFFVQMCPESDIVALVEKEVAKLAQEYIVHMLQFANADQKEQIKNLAKTFLSNN